MSEHDEWERTKEKLNRTLSTRIEVDADVPKKFLYDSKFSSSY